MGARDQMRSSSERGAVRDAGGVGPSGSDGDQTQDPISTRPKRRVTPTVIPFGEEIRNRQLPHGTPMVDDESRFQERLRVFLETRAAAGVQHGITRPSYDTTTHDDAVDAASSFALGRHNQLLIPIFCREKLKLKALFDEVRRNGGYHVVTRCKLWRTMCTNLGFDLEGQTSASYAMRRNYEKVGLYVYEMCDSDASASRETIDANAASKSRAAENLANEKGLKQLNHTTRVAKKYKENEEVYGWRYDDEKHASNQTALEINSRNHLRFLKRNLPSAFSLHKVGKKPTYNVTDTSEAALARGLNILQSVDPISNPVEHGFLFPGINEHDYVTVRNHVLGRWRDDPNYYLSVEHAATWFRGKHRPLVHCAHRFLTTTGLINFGVGFTSNYLDDDAHSAWGATKGCVVVVGAGLAGLQCARQLLMFGHRVVVVEARDRAGGRVWSKQLSGTCPTTGTKKTAVAEMGGSIVTGSDGNPLSIIAKQLNLKSRPIRDTCPMYLERLNGKQVDTTVDDKVFEAYNGQGGALEGVNELRTRVGDEADKMTLGETLDLVKNEKGVISKTGAENDLWHWHLANLEFANATRLDTLSLGQWDQDDPFEFGGDHEWLPRGNSRVVAALARDVDVFYNTPVDRIVDETDGDGSYSNQAGVKVIAKDGRTFVADAVVVTVPLGVLKRGDLKFTPELPLRKKQAIENLGFGALNKVLLLFPKTFWDTEHDTFGYVNSCDAGIENRGRFFMFYSYDGEELSGGSTLIALIAGDAALSVESSEIDSETVQGVMTVLREIFEKRQITVPDPVDSHVTRWGMDPYARGSYSNISPRGTGDDYDALAAPVGDKLFFAGEATSRQHPATMHGAFLSGNREAARVHQVLKTKGKKREIVRNGDVSRKDSKDAWTT